MSSDQANRFTELVNRQRSQYEQAAATYGDDKKAKAAAAARAAKYRADTKAIRELESIVIPVLQEAKAGMEATGLDVIISKNWNDEGATLSVSTARFQCASRIVASGTGYPTIDSKIAVFRFSGTAIDYGFEGPEALPLLTARPDKFDSADQLIVWTIEEIVASYYHELAKLTYLKA